MVNTETFSITNTTKGKLPRLPFVVMKEKVLGKGYDLSLVFVPPSVAKELNQKYRSKSYTPNVLSFTLDKKGGEIFICPTIAKKEASTFGLTYKKYIGYLFIHGLFHLKGMKHSSTMETSEKKVRIIFGIK